MRIIAIICLLTLTACATPSPKSQADCVKNYNPAAKFLFGPLAENFACSGNALPKPVE